ncbi:hypothetical protein DPMN_170018 [Dreissena polymorpha]|uniref:Complex 1 LYR protein domain-containing protein n=2 Tax=Dreissena polymorpha TaxID=45954 RepID=A0A9D4IDW5_DREPO|nr:hypothetical protein DPMN_170018 [Dreissena polymorpha]
MYALDKIRHDFRANKNVTEPAQLDVLLKKARENLDVIKRQAVIGHMYGEGHLVIENRPSQSQSTT